MSELLARYAMKRFFIIGTFLLFSFNLDGREVLLNIDVNNLTNFDSKSNKWIVEPGQYKIPAALSSKDVRQVASFQIRR